MDEGMLEVEKGGKANDWKVARRRFGYKCRKRFLKRISGRNRSAADEGVAGWRWLRGQGILNIILSHAICFRLLLNGNR